jgi:hypothetical protein
MSTFEIWMWLKLDDVNNLLGLFFTIYVLLWVIISGFTFYLYITECEDEFIRVKKIFKILLFFIPVWFIVNFTPSTKEYAVIKVLPKIANSDFTKQIQKDMPEIYTMAIEKMKSILKEEKK